MREGGFDTLADLFYVSAVGFVFSAIISLISIKAGKNVTAASLILSALSSIALSLFSSIIIYKNESVSFFLYQLIPALQFSFFIDRLSAFFILIISIVSLSVSIYSIGYIEHYKSSQKRGALASLMAFFILSMVLVVASKTLFSFLFFWELMALSSFILVMFEYEEKETRKAGLFYFIMTQLSTVFLLLAFIMIYVATGSFEMSPLSGQSHLFIEFLFIFLFLGFGIKAGVIPFHKWLPYAHPASPSNISALMSGVMLKVAIYGLMRFMLFILKPELSWGFLIFFFGLISAILGIIYAFKDNDVKRLLAFSSIENIGIVLIGLGLYIIFNAYGFPEVAVLGMAGALVHIFNHALFKSLLFLTSGSIAYSAKTKNIEKLGGLVKTMPYTAMFFFVGAISISALPPFNGFISEFMIFQAFLTSFSLHSRILEVVMIAGLFIFALTSALAAACFVKAFGITFLAAPRTEEAKNAKEVPFSMLLGPAILSILCIAFGLFSFQIFSLIGYSYLIPNMLEIGIMLTVVYLFAFLAMRNSQSRISETWGCGILSQNPRMEYTASGFTGPITTIFGSIYKTKKISDKSYYDKYQSIFKEGSATIKLMKFFEETFYLPVARAVNSFSFKVSEIQRGDLDTHIVYAFITIVLLLIFAGLVA